MSTDLTALQRLIKLPAEVKQVEWQTGKFAPQGGDWWVAAVLEVDADRMGSFLQGPATAELVETPPGMTLTSSFAALKALPGAQMIDANRVRMVVDTHGVDVYARSPLLNGQAMRLSASQVFVVLRTL